MTETRAVYDDFDRSSINNHSDTDSSSDEENNNVPLISTRIQTGMRRSEPMISFSQMNKKKYIVILVVILLIILINIYISQS